MAASMNLPLLMKLVKLANHNPNDHEANAAARRVCQMIEAAGFQFGAGTPADKYPKTRQRYGPHSGRSQPGQAPPRTTPADWQTDADKRARERQQENQYRAEQHDKARQYQQQREGVFDQADSRSPGPTTQDIADLLDWLRRGGY